MMGMGRLDSLYLPTSFSRPLIRILSNSQALRVVLCLHAMGIKVPSMNLRGGRLKVSSVVVLTMHSGVYGWNLSVAKNSRRRKLYSDAVSSLKQTPPTVEEDGSLWRYPLLLPTNHNKLIIPGNPQGRRDRAGVTSSAQEREKDKIEKSKESSRRGNNQETHPTTSFHLRFSQWRKYWTGYACTSPRQTIRHLEKYQRTRPRHSFPETSTKEEYGV